ncbi:cation:proton antiporter [Lipingzhangella sp. LS1_29]|uniref:Cation:proton antiporter n=1 Tax=Lipingzhangella rawalii TaxID=2055835 RepID=A0ABU2H5D2_9ACTN|nr:cation:proton antiporter [Lipingzhangella rawalii]MDS1270517.1 cation:proton antiporter [Lipingzhangella rawalii]
MDAAAVVTGMALPLAAALIAGLAAMAVRLPPMVGFLAAGFALNAYGFPADPAQQDIAGVIDVLADVGVTLLLFTIGLKLNVRTLLRPEIWGTATLHMLGSTTLFVGVVGAIKLLGFTLLHDADAITLILVGFALSFSSTVFAVKTLEERSEMGSLYGRLAIGVLIMQDVFAVVFITGSTGQLPSPWALALLLLIPLAPVLQRLLDRIGHGEMQILYGIAAALLLGFVLFESVGIKGDLGALIVGMLLAPAINAASLASAMFHLKELFLVGFFLSIGLTALPDLESLLLALLLLLVVPVKSLMYVALFLRFRLRGRTALLSGLSLSNFSEFGLIVAALATGQGWLDDQWLVVLALTVALSFAIAAPLNTRGEGLYRVSRRRLTRHQREHLHPSDQPVDLSGAQAVVLGMGRVGQGAYDQLSQVHGLRPLGVEHSPERIRELRSAGYQVVEGDAADADFWDRLMLAEETRIVLLAMPHQHGNQSALAQLRDRRPHLTIAGVVNHTDEIDELHREGADAVFHLYAEAGQALADDAIRASRTR